MKIGLVGNQNSGKTTLFNCLTGMNAKVGNWPGVTIEKKSGIVKGTNHEITDLPGIYSISPYSIEEEVSRKFILEEKPDVIINIVDATSIERSLYLTTQLLELDCKIIVALNMADILEKKGLKIDDQKLSERLGVPVVRISALKETGINNLITAIDKPYERRPIKVFDDNIEKAAQDIGNELGKDIIDKKFISINLMQEDSKFDEYKTDSITKIVEELKPKYDTDMEEEIATQRYNFIEKIRKECVVKKIIPASISDKLDKIFLNKWLAFPIFVVIMFLVYYLSVGVVGSYTVDAIGSLMDSLGEAVRGGLESIGTAEPLVSLVVDGIIAGVGAVLGFVPQLIILFLCIALLETTGYMSRIALLLDKLFRKIGLSGKSLIPFIVGSGCSVPGIMTSRIIENDDERTMTTILTPFIPCSAKLPIIALFTGYFFKDNAGIASASFYFLAIAIIIVSALIMKKFIFKHTSSTYISELPDYKLPSPKYVAKEVWDKVIAFIKRAGTIILLCSIVVWFLLSFSFNMQYGVDVEDSMLAQIGDKISWIFEPVIGTRSWGATVSAVQGLIAKEQVVSSMAVINGLSDDVSEGSQIFSAGGNFSFFTPASAYAFMTFNLFCAPCVGAIGALRSELKSRKKLAGALTFQTVFAWVFATIVYQIGSRIESGVLNIANIAVIAIIIAVVAIIIHQFRKNKNAECSGCPYCDSCGKVKNND